MGEMTWFDRFLFWVMERLGLMETVPFIRDGVVVNDVEAPTPTETTP